MKKIIMIIIAAVVFAALIFSCANQVAPGGGPEDKTPPEVDRSLPAHGQTNVDPRSSVSILFSEWINASTAPRAVSVFPTLAKGVSVKASKDKITIKPREPLAANTTYQIVIGTTLQDLRGNAIAEPIMIAFTTGAALDSGRVEGVIIPYGKKPTAQPRVSLFYEDGEWDDAKYFTLPEYAAQSDSAGEFKFSYLREGRYRVIAFTDEYRTGRMRAGDECYTPVEQTITVTKSEQFVSLYPSNSDTAVARKDTAAADTAGNIGADTAAVAASDTTTPELKSYIPSKKSSLKPELRLIWTKPARLGLTTVVAVDTAGVDSVPFFRAVETGFSDTTLLVSGRSLKPGNIYKLSIPPQAVKDERGNVAVGKAKKIPVASEGGGDDENGKGNDSKDTVAVADTADTKTVAVDSTDKSVADSIDAGSDTAVVAAADSLEIFTIEVVLNTVSADSICYRLQGGAECLAETPDEHRKWVYTPIGFEERFFARDKSGTFTYDSIPASKGTLMWFSDTDNDNRVTHGKLIPWRAPERFFFAPDTVEAKARWEIEGLKVDACPKN